MKRESWPVTPGCVSPIGAPDACFYCKAKVGAEHAACCVRRRRTVVCRVAFEYVREVPEDWGADDIEFHMNDSSSCANNLFHELEVVVRALDATGGCLCSLTTGTYVREATAYDEADSGRPDAPAK